MKPIKYLGITALFLLSIFMSFAGEPIFGDRKDLGQLKTQKIPEASGIAASRKNPGVLWTHNDSDNGPVIFAINTNGDLLAEYELKDTKDVDWEDIAIGPGPEQGIDYIYIGDIGDNDAQRKVKTIFRLKEPDVKFNQSAIKKKTNDYDEIRFEYPDGKRDAETLLIDPLTKSLFVISKRESKVHIYEADYPQSTTKKFTLKYHGEMSLGFSGSDAAMINGGDISPDGKEILIKNYTNVYLFSRPNGKSVADALLSKPEKVNYIPEPQGEGICWAYDGSGFYTLSEEQFGIAQHLYYYPGITSSASSKNKKKH